MIQDVKSSCVAFDVTFIDRTEGCNMSGLSLHQGILSSFY